MTEQSSRKTVYRAGRVVYCSDRGVYHPVRARNGAPLYDGVRADTLWKQRSGTR